MNRARLRSGAIFVAKAAVATALVVWLVRSGTLDFGALAVFFERPWLGAADLGLFAIMIAAAALRWRALLGIADVEMPVRRALALQLVATFFNTVIPGNVGGDVLKALYAARDAAPEKRTPILLIVFVDRLVGLAALLLTGTVAVLARPEILADPLLRPFARIVVVLGAAAVAGPIAFLFFMSRAGPRLEAWTTGTTAIAKTLGRLVQATRLLASGPRGLAVALGLSMAQHASTMLFFALLAGARAGGGGLVAYGAIASVYPFGILTMILPVSPGGIGVGHVAFEKLFALVGVAGGATIFNMYLIGQMVPSVLGVIPYLSLKRAERAEKEPRLRRDVASL